MESQASSPTLVHSRLEALRLPPYFFGVITASGLGDVAALWDRLNASERRDLLAFELAFRPAHRHEMRGKRSEAAEVLRALMTRHPRFAVIAQSRLQTMGLAEDPFGESDRG